MTSLSLLLTGHWLVVDDQELCRKAAFYALEHLGATCDFASDGLEALAALENYPYVGMLIDGSMPNMSGFQAVRKIREKETDVGGNALPIIMITGEPNVAVEDCGKLVDLVMEKPLRVRPNSLLLAIVEVSVTRTKAQTGSSFASKASAWACSTARVIARLVKPSKFASSAAGHRPVFGACFAPREIGAMAQLFHNPGDLLDRRAYVAAVAGLLRGSEPRERLEIERHGVALSFIEFLGVCLGMSRVRLFEVLGMPALLKTELIRGSPAFAALALTELLGKALQMDESSISARHRGFDTGAWLGRWIETPQPAIGGIRPSSIIALPTGLPLLLKALASIGGCSIK